jgi:hypothetical protein
MKIKRKLYRTVICLYGTELANLTIAHNPGRICLHKSVRNQVTGKLEVR